MGKKIDHKIYEYYLAIDGRDEGRSDAQPHNKHSVEILSQEQGLQCCKKLPTKSWRKDEYVAWITKHDIKFDPPEMKMELMIHPTEIRTSISPSSAVELNTTSALANYTTDAGDWTREMKKDASETQPFIIQIGNNESDSDEEVLAVPLLPVFVKNWYNLTAGVFRVHVPQITGLQGFTEPLPSQGVKPREKQLGQEGSTLFRAWDFSTKELSKDTSKPICILLSTLITLFKHHILLRIRENISELNELFPPEEDSCPWKLVTPKPVGVVKDVLLKVTHAMIRKIFLPHFCLLRRSHLSRPEHKACRLGEHDRVGQVKCSPGREPRTPSSSLVFA
uniref:Uncharacterized protein n=1 Tax=Timema shepardi TaxID=629360 RepID=A0A7R9AR22_TIMSH|nr:unnamed protein product [Timema shepardi]